jgi:cyclopropane fatty-acyl-phospholipid synthase-like methyltransferase
MANQHNIEETYDYMVELFRFIIGENGDITCTMYSREKPWLFGG